ncbi:hypothetical protein GCM10007874_22350 [Labrys miyagiensis]|uniref:Uncharacterized protein n=1 Tax=Labrys miyagiensis TaxID=346912 RepID=A0ABQ6CFT1_9HYPH|nr:hypothetical protein GCM10007874_22350 [Labrys miyagiensis]
MVEEATTTRRLDDWGTRRRRRCRNGGKRWRGKTKYQSKRYRNLDSHEAVPDHPSHAYTM